MRLPVIIRDGAVLLRDGEPLPLGDADAATLILPASAIFDEALRERLITEFVDSFPHSPHLATNEYDHTSPLLHRALACLAGLDAGTHGTLSPTGRGECADSPGAGARRAAEGALAHLVDGTRCLLGPESLVGFIRRDGGNEHDTYTNPARPSWRVKVTGPNLDFRNGKSRWSTSVLEYLTSWHLANQVFGDGVELLGVLPTTEGMCLMIAQPEVEAADPDQPHPTKPQIYGWMRLAGFEYQSGAWVRQADGILVSDEHEGNFILTAEGLRPIDVQLRVLPGNRGPLITWNQNPANPHRTRACPALD